MRKLLPAWTQTAVYAACREYARSRLDMAKKVEQIEQPIVEVLPELRLHKRRIVQSDILAYCKQYDGEKFHALLCDPPYHLTSITERFGKANAAPAKFGTDGAFSRASRGFMGKQWDGGDIAFDPATWAALADLLLDGAFGMAFASSRGWHRLAVAIEDAGLIIHPTIFNWTYGSGFPKATRIPDERFEGHRYGGQALKPSAEPIIVFQRPYVGRPVDCITRTGAGTINIDAGRIGTDEIGTPREYRERSSRDDWRMTGSSNGTGATSPLGRWPANFILTHDPRCNGTCTPECPVRRLGEQSGERKSGSSLTGNEPSSPSGKNVFNRRNRQPYESYDDSGTASRFFFQADWQHEVAEQLAQADPVRYEAKASTDERNRGLFGYVPQTVDDGRNKPIDNPYLRGETQRLNTHPTVKPIALAEYLAKLLLPPIAFAPRRLLVPFAGSGSECVGAMLAGWEEVIGVEREQEYADIARTRLAYYESLPMQLEMF
jgi:site-specific DNA-methyltransferase (adenine-specific)